MVHYSTISGHLSQLKKEICDFESNCQTKPLKSTSCGSDCYCRKQGNHKVTNSIYHKDCISMKKSVSVRKCELVQPRNKSTERKEIFHLDKAQVEVSLKSSSKDIKNVKSCSKHEIVKEKRQSKLVDTGSDPIMILEPKKLPKKCWSTLLSENSKSGSGLQATRAPFDPPVKLKSSSTTSSFPDHSSPSSQSPERGSKRIKSVIVRDRAVQYEQIDDTENGHHNVFNNDCPPSLYNPLNTLQTLLKELKGFKRQLNDKSSVNNLNSIICDMDFAVNRLTQPYANVASSAPVSYFGKIDSDSSPVMQNKPSMTVPKPTYKGLEKTLEETCYQLQTSCIKLEETCQKLRKEKDNITEQFFKKSHELERCLKRELEYQAKLNEANQSAEAMSQKLDQYTKSMEELSVHMRKLQAENKALERAEDAKESLLKQLMEATQENEQLNAQVQLMTLEREKNKVLLDIKEQEVAKLKAELRSIGGLVSEKMLETAMGGDSLLMTSRLELSESREVAFSSPDGSLTSPSKSWKAMSSIISPSRPRRPLPPPSNIDSKGSSAAVDKRHPLESINHLKNELRELFAQMKQQTELSEPVIPEISPAGGAMSPWSAVTDSSDGYNSITENELSEVT